MAEVEGPRELRTAPAAGRATRSDNPLIRAIQRVPAGVGAKLLVALLAAVAFVVVIGLLGLRTIADANDRAAALRVLQQRATVYRALQAEVEQVHQLLGLRAGGPDLTTYVGGTPATAPTGGALVLLDQTIATTLTKLGPGGDAADLAADVPSDERAVLDQVAADE